jgi:hypothetical protein
MTPELLTELSRGNRLRHAAQRRVEYALLICVFGLVIEFIQHFTPENLRPLTLSVLAIAAVMAASAWPVAVEYQRSARKARWLRAHEDRSQRILPNSPDPFETPPPGFTAAGRRGKPA